MLSTLRSIPLTRLPRSSWRGWLLMTVSFAAFFVYAWFPYVTSQPRIIFPSPDATANFFWVERFADTGKLWYADVYNTIADGIVVPRSMNVTDGTVEPMSFLGIILFYGTLARFTGSYAALYFTPLFAVAGAWFLYGIVRRVFDERSALVSALAALTLAPYWYFSSRGLMHNVLFAVLALGGGWLGLVVREQVDALPKNGPIGRRLRAAVALPFAAGLFFGAALLVRTSEAPWLGVVMGMYAIILSWPVSRTGKKDRRRWFARVPWSAPLAFAAGAGAMVVILLYYNTLLYGAPLNFGYPSRLNTLIETVQHATSGTAVEASMPWWDVVFELLFPFEIHPRAVGRHFQQYYIEMFWYLFWPAVLGIAVTLARFRRTTIGEWIYLLTWLGLSGYIVLLYGSWLINDNPSGNATIGNSYTRYWLPMYLLALPFAARALVTVADGSAWLAGRAKLPATWQSRFAIALITLGTLVAMGKGGYEALAGKEEGLVYMHRAIARDRPHAATALALTEPGSVVISERFDKFFFPQRRVVVGHLTDNNYNGRYARLIAAGIPVYYYGFTLPPRDFEYLDTRKLPAADLRIETVQGFDTGVTLYRLLPAYE